MYSSQKNILSRQALVLQLRVGDTKTTQADIKGKEYTILFIMTDETARGRERKYWRYACTACIGGEAFT